MARASLNAFFSKSALIREIKHILRYSPGFKRIEKISQLERIADLMAYGPLPVKRVDVELARLGFVEIYDEDKGNESVDIEGDVYHSMEAADILESANEEFYGIKGRN